MTVLAGAVVIAAALGWVVYVLRSRQSRPFEEHPEETLHLR